MCLDFEGEKEYNYNYKSQNCGHVHDVVERVRLPLVHDPTDYEVNLVFKLRASQICFNLTIIVIPKRF